MFFTPATHQLFPQNKPANNPVRFGCRLFAYNTSDPGQEGQDEFIRQILVKGGNSMERQNQLPFAQFGDLNRPAIPNFPGLAETIAKKTGWGLVYAVNPPKSDSDDTANTLRSGFKGYYSPLPICQSNDAFKQAAEQVATQTGESMDGFLRETAPEQEPVTNPEHNHPLQVGDADWTFMHRGNLAKSFTKDLDKQLAFLHSKYPKIPLPKTNIDSERLACYFAARLVMKYDTVNIGQLSQDQVNEELKQCIKTFRNWPGVKRWDSEKDKLFHPLCNYTILINNGRRRFGVKDISDFLPPTDRAKTAFFIGKHPNEADNLEVLFQTDKTQPKAGKPIEWEVVPNHIVFSLDMPAPIKVKKNMKKTTVPLKTLTI